MHEWALAESVILAALSRAQEGKIKKVVIRLGELQQVDEEIFSFALRELAKLYEIDAEFEIKEEKATVRCRRCGFTFSFAEALSHLDESSKEAIHFVPELVKSFVSCPKCGSSDLEIISGRGVSIEEVITE